MLQLSFVNFRKDSFIVVEGKSDTENFYIIQSGKVRTFREIEVPDNVQKVLGPGDFVGVSVLGKNQKPAFSGSAFFEANEEFEKNFYADARNYRYASRLHILRCCRERFG